MFSTFGWAGKLIVNMSARLTYSIHSWARPAPDMSRHAAGTRTRRQRRDLIRQPPEREERMQSLAMATVKPDRDISAPTGGGHMYRPVRLLPVVLLASIGLALAYAQRPPAQNNSPGGW